MPWKAPEKDSRTARPINSHMYDHRRRNTAAAIKKQPPPPPVELVAAWIRAVSACGVSVRGTRSRTTTTAIATAYLDYGSNSI